MHRNNSSSQAKLVNFIKDNIGWKHVLLITTLAMCNQFNVADKLYIPIGLSTNSNSKISQGADISYEIFVSTNLNRC